MEHGRSIELDYGRLYELEHLAIEALENPDTISYKLHYTLNLGDGQNARFVLTDEPKAAEQRAVNKTAVYINTLEPLQEYVGERDRLGFSCVFDHLNQSIRGNMVVSPIDLPAPSPGMTEAEITAMEHALLLAESLYEQHFMARSRREAFWFKAESHQISPDLNQMLQPFLTYSNQLLARGVYHKRQTKTFAVDNREVTVTSNYFDGDISHFCEDINRFGKIHIKYSDEDLIHEYIHSQADGYEIISKIKDPAMRYAHYDTYEVIYDDDNKSVGSSVSPAEIAQKEQVDRDYGMFVPTNEKLDTFISMLARQ